MKWFPICVRNEIFADKWRNWVLTLNPVVFLASLVLIVAFSAIESRHAQAAEGAASNYFPGAYGSLLPGVAPEPGTVLQSLNLYYNGDANRAILQGAVNVGISAEVQANLLQGLYVWDAPAINGRFAVGGYLSRADATLNASLTVGPLAAGFSRDNSGLGDSGIIPASFFWNSRNFHFNLYELIIAPTGEYSSTSLVNVGRNYWSFDTVLATTWFNQETGTDLSVVAGIMANTENSATNYKTGTEFHADFMVNQFLSETFAVGVHGYLYRQLSGDSGSGARLGSFKGEGAGFGLALNWIPAAASGKVIVSGKWMKDVEAVNRLKAEYGVVSLVVTF